MKAERCANNIKRTKKGAGKQMKAERCANNIVLGFPAPERGCLLVVATRLK